jgi:hypothetical protein
LCRMFAGYSCFCSISCIHFVYSFCCYCCCWCSFTCVDTTTGWESILYAKTLLSLQNGLRSFQHYIGRIFGPGSNLW